MNTLDFALHYLANGFSVIPLKKDKRPLLDSWKEYQDRHPSEDEIKNWWALHPDALVGIVTGKISGLSVVDIEAGGDSSIFPETYTVRTGRGGWHLYYDYADIGNMVRAFPLVDVRGNGGYVVAPPSKTEFVGKSGKMEGGEYTVIDDLPRMPFPIGLFQRAHQGKFDPKVLAGVGEGSRNASAASVAGFLLGKTKPEEYMLAWELLKGWNALNTPPLDSQELKSVFESIMKREASKEPEEKDDIEIVPLAQAAAAMENQTAERLSTGFDFLDESARGGFGAGELWVIAAPQGQGKTTFGMEMTLNLAARGRKTLWLTYELLIDELWQKFKWMGAADDFSSYTTLKPMKGDIELVEKAIKKAVTQENARVVFIDHFGRLGGKIKKYDESMSSNMAVYLAAMAERLKEIALEQKISIVLMAHTRKQDKYKRAQTTSDIANTSGLGNEATMSILLDRETEGFSDDGGDKYTGKLFVRVDKARWGKEQTVAMKFEDGRISKWVEPAKVEQPKRHF